MKKRLLRYLSALIASLICTYTGLRAHADTTDPASCGLTDVSAWQVALENPEEEGTPTYIQSVTENFIARCPNRPEKGEAHRIAGTAAAWAGHVQAAASHFEKMGHVTDMESLLMHAAVRFSLGETERATSIRDNAIDSWTGRLERLGLATVETERIQNGEIIQVAFNKTHPEVRMSHMWIARPDAPAWPAALLVTSERQLNAFHRLTAGNTAPTQHYIRLYRCKARKLMAQTSTKLSQTDMTTAARLSLTAYMANPDRPAAGNLSACLFNSRILPDVSYTSSIPVQ